MAKTFLALLGAAAVLIVSFLVSLRLIDHFGLFSARSGPLVSLTANGQDSIVIPAGTYKLSYASSGARSCEMRYRNADNGSGGKYPVPPNQSGTADSGMIGDYTLTCIAPDGATASKTVTSSRPPK